MAEVKGAYPVMPAEQQSPAAETIDAFVLGESEAFSELFQVYGGAVFAIVRRYFYAPHEQEEVFQEVWMQAYRARGHFDRGRNTGFLPWLRQLARNRCIDLLRAKGVRPELREERDVAGGDTPELQHRNQRIREGLREFCESLSGQEREFFQLCLVEERSHEAIGSQLGISVRRSKYLKKKMLAKIADHPALRILREETCTSSG